MAITITCPSCATQLRLPEKSSAKRARCPRCGGIVALTPPEAAAEDQGREERLTERPPARAPRAESAAEPPPLPPPQGCLPATEVPPDEEDGYKLAIAPASALPSALTKPAEAVEPPDDLEDRPRKKKKRKGSKKSRERFEDGDEPPKWPWWVFGGGGVALTMFILLCLTVFLSFGHPLKWISVYLLVFLPVGTVMFFLAMFLSSVLLGAIEIGEIHVALFKAFFLVLLVDLTQLLPFGLWLSWFVLLVGLITIFKLDIWEARMLFLIYVLLNVVLNFILWSILFSWAEGRRADDRFQPPGRNAPFDPGRDFDPD
jgi:hypothetical protein